MKESDLMFGIVKCQEGAKVLVKSDNFELYTILRKLLSKNQQIGEPIFNAVMAFLVEETDENELKEWFDNIIDMKRQKGEEIKRQKDFLDKYVEMSPEVKRLISQMEKTANGIKS